MRYANEEYNARYWVITDNEKGNISKGQLDELPDGFYFVGGFKEVEEARDFAGILLNEIRGFRVKIWNSEEGECVWSRHEKMEKNKNDGR